ncbi:hypothetical protein JY651_21405 [Pyxidicoccus parkwayensis]|uniref:Flagellar hook-length control protein-like C-terminal domain-containing protein n=1 Tax=Pyxidicoccus parkwayensis TaxID=2813578 RepID=A0ABX7PA42_9BACT|nr:hypothetical protein [Pyxidicoccus parkwaysis]QSQ27307.1 hypothetical protein JY651_21405 [Pyxidicoccus parkwaysis]
MKVDAPESPSNAAQEKQAPDGARFKKALQEADARRARDAGPPARAGRAPASGTVPPLRPGAVSARSSGLTGARAPAPPATRASGPVLATSRGALASAENLGRTRQAMHTEAQRLGTVRSEASTQSQERTEHRLTDLIRRELTREAPPADARPATTSPAPDTRRAATDAPAPESGVAGVAGATAAGSGGAASTEAVSATTSADAALEIIERIEVFVKSQRPALSLSLRGSLDATVEVERTGPREVALRIQGRRGPIPTGDLARLRDALEARGLRLRSLRAE